jgi:ABC-type nickel/cobalt efflux system permease component RcnA
MKCGALWTFVPFLVLLLAPGSLATAHPVPRRTYDRTVQVRLTHDAVEVLYRLEVDEWTVVYVDLDAVRDQVDLTKLSGPREFYDAFTRCYSPILASNLTARLDGQPLSFTCTRHGHQVLDHLRCDFVFRAAWKPAPGQPHEFSFRDDNYTLESGALRLSLEPAAGVSLVQIDQPSEALRARSSADLQPGDDAKRRRASATFELTSTPAPTAAPPPEKDAAPPRRGSLLALLDRDEALWLLLLLAAGVGAIHALTPGHGKTLVAAYLVGERGTVWHALLLGVVTTLTHTGVVLALAVALGLLFPGGKMSEQQQQGVQLVLELGGGLLIVALGFWLLLRRLSGAADHFHIGGQGHHHHPHPHSHGGGPADHYHDAHGHAHPLPTASSAGAWGLIVLGISGGLVPCWDAIAMLVLAVALNLLWLALPLLLAFSAGLAGVLVLIGVLVVRARGLVGGWAEGRLLRALPLVSALLITGMGLWLCYDSLHP